MRSILTPGARTFGFGGRRKLVGVIQYMVASLYACWRHSMHVLAQLLDNTGIATIKEWCGSRSGVGPSTKHPGRGMVRGADHHHKGTKDVAPACCGVMNVGQGSCR